MTAKNVWLGLAALLLAAIAFVAITSDRDEDSDSPEPSGSPPQPSVSQEPQEVVHQGSDDPAHRQSVSEPSVGADADLPAEDLAPPSESEASRAFGPTEARDLVRHVLRIAEIEGDLDLSEMSATQIDELCDAVSQFMSSVQPALHKEHTRFASIVSERLQSSGAYERHAMPRFESESERQEHIRMLCGSNPADLVHVSDYRDHIRIVRVIPGDDPGIDAARAQSRAAYRSFADKIMYRYGSFVVMK